MKGTRRSIAGKREWGNERGIGEVIWARGCWRDRVRIKRKGSVDGDSGKKKRHGK